MDTYKYTYKELEEKYGIEARRLIKEFESLSLKTGRNQSHLRFNLQYKANKEPCD